MTVAPVFRRYTPIGVASQRQFPCFQTGDTDSTVVVGQAGLISLAPGEAAVDGIATVNQVVVRAKKHVNARGRFPKCGLDSREGIFPPGIVHMRCGKWNKSGFPPMPSPVRTNVDKCIPGPSFDRSWCENPPLACNKRRILDRAASARNIVRHEFFGNGPGNTGIF